MSEKATKAQVRDARNFIADCTSSYMRNLTDDMVVSWIQANYVGGWAQFIADGK